VRLNFGRFGGKERANFVTLGLTPAYFTLHICFVLFIHWVFLDINKDGIVNFQYFSVRMISHVEIVWLFLKPSLDWLRLFFILGSSYQQG